MLSRSRIFLLATLSFIFSSLCLSAQIGINADGSAPDSSAGLDVKFSDKGVLIPRMTVFQRNAITNPAPGLMVFCTDCGTDGALSFYSGGTWKTFSFCSVAAPVAGTQVPGRTDVTWNWDPVDGALGYRWSTVNNYSEATDMGTLTTKADTGIACETVHTRYVWAYNACSVSEPAVLTATTTSCWLGCGFPFTDTRDGKSYQTVLINGVCWLAQSMNIGTMIPGAKEMQNNDTLEKYCYGNNEANCSEYGALYQWAEVVQYLNGATNNTSWNPVPTGNVRGICPSGWHVPTVNEYQALRTFAGGGLVAGGNLKETGLTHWNSPNAGAANTVGFTAIGAGMRQTLVNYRFEHITGINQLYTATEGQYYAGYYFDIRYDEATLNWGYDQKAVGRSVRCIHD